jgi:transcriptional antiterminator NusG
MAKKWYVIHTYSGYENKVKTNLLHRIQSMGMDEKIFKVEIPTETVTELKEGGRRVTSDKKVFPGYILVQMELDDESWYVVRNTPGVTGFVGSQGKPVPLSRDEFGRIMKRTEAGVKQRTSTDLTEGMSVKAPSPKSTLMLARLRSWSPSLAARPRLSLASTRLHDSRIGSIRCVSRLRD